MTITTPYVTIRRRFRRGTPFWDRVAIGHTQACWPWLGYCRPEGYGELRVGGQKIFAHRHAYVMTHDEEPIPQGLVVRHRCDNPPCCNPMHLDLGTHADNARDKIERGRDRSPRGVTHPRGKFTDEQIAQVSSLHEEGLSNLTIAERLGMSPSYVCHVLKGRARA